MEYYRWIINRDQGRPTLATHHGKGLVRLENKASATIEITVDGSPIVARVGETVLIALISEWGYIRNCEFSGERRAGFCLMGACQDCWLWHSTGEPVRACTRFVEAGMSLRTADPRAGA
jgi:predicted molibdopterin-dependent oxidoreductase YjgC